MTLEEAKAAGYCIVSRRYRTATRIDRPDWREYMAKKHAPWDWEGQGMKWANYPRMGDQYRRVYSKDDITVPAEWLSKLGNSNGGPDKYLEKTNEKRLSDRTS